jgi:hypothetical protein
VCIIMISSRNAMSYLGHNHRVATLLYVRYCRCGIETTPAAGLADIAPLR